MLTYYITEFFGDIFDTTIAIYFEEVRIFLLKGDDGFSIVVKNFETLSDGLEIVIDTVLGFGTKQKTVYEFFIWNMEVYYKVDVDFVFGKKSV